MPNPTRQEIIDANNALAALVCVALSNTADPDEKDWIRTIARALTTALPPKPQPTMAEVEWDDEEHYLAEAEHVDWGKVVMLYYDGQFNRIQYFCKLDEPNMVVYSDPANLTLTGKRYTLTEVQDG